MPKTLVIVESPAKCKKIEDYLGPGYKCIASFGHIQGLNNKLGMKCIDIESNFKPKFAQLQEKQKNIAKLKSEIALADEVVLATDDDREGEAIAWHICNVCHLPVNTTKRIIFHEITKTAINSAVKSPGTINMNIVNAALARQILDFIVGYMLSPLLWSNISRNSKDGLSAGRCQTPALRIVYDNQKDIDSSPGKKVYNTTGYFTKETLPYILDHNYNDESTMENFLEESVNHDHVYTCANPRSVTKNPPTPFTTSTLQQTASSNFSISPKDTMRIAQTLYEGGYITYMRTDSKTYSKEFIDKVKPFIKEKYGEEYIHKNVDALSERATDNKKSAKKTSKKKEEENKAQEAHEAIRPTDITCLSVKDDMHPREKKIYQLIWRTTMESCMEAAKFTSITSSITAPENHKYKYSTEQVVFPGWKIVGGYEKENPLYTYLQTIKNGSTLDYKKIVAKVSMKDLKSHLTEAKLVQMLEQKGIGRPSTFSSLIDKIQERGYVKKEDVKGKKIKCIDFELVEDTITENTNEREFGNEKGKLVIQQVGHLVIEFLLKHFSELFDYDYTKSMEDNLDVIANGSKTWHTLCKECYSQIQDLSKDLITEKKDKLSIKIDEHHSYIVGKNGPCIMYKNGDKTSFKSVKKDIDIDMLKEGRLTLEDIIEEKGFTGRKLGEYQGHELILKKGKFGFYVSWGENKKSFSWLTCEECEITYEFIIEKMENGNPNIVRTINKDISIRNGKFGHYIFYKTDKMNKPKFIKLQGFKEDYKECDQQLIIDFVTKK